MERGAGMSDAVVWRIAEFDEMTGREVHDLLALRQAAFVVEQSCPFPEIDGRDPLARHVLGLRRGEIVACARLLPAGAKMAARSIGRVVMAQALAVLLAEEGGAPIDLSAQAHLERFYASLGFHAFGTPYDEDGIPHIDMRLEPDKR
jgi:ElaA protein